MSSDGQHMDRDPVPRLLKRICPSPEKAIAVLLLENPIEDLLVHVGGLGDQLFEQAVYAYVGPTYEEDRKRWKSLRRWKRCHLEYLLRTSLIRVVGKCCRDATEGPDAHFVARRMRWYGSAVQGFDVYYCGCESHLIRVDDIYGLLEELQKNGFECYLGEKARLEVESVLIELDRVRSKGSTTRFQRSVLSENGLF